MHKRAFSICVIMRLFFMHGHEMLQIKPNGCSRELDRCLGCLWFICSVYSERIIRSPTLIRYTTCRFEVERLSEETDQFLRAFVRSILLNYSITVGPQGALHVCRIWEFIFWGNSDVGLSSGQTLPWALISISEKSTSGNIMKHKRSDGAWVLEAILRLSL